MKKIQHLLI